MLTVNHCPWCKAWPAYALVTCTLLAALIMPIRAHAQLTGKASATAQFESNSNVFDVQSGYSQNGIYGTRRSDTDYSYGASLEGDYAWERQQIYARASTKEYEYQHFTELNHDDFSFDTGLLWKLGTTLDGKLDVSRTRTMVPFLDLTGTAQTLSLATSETEAAQIGYLLNSDWRIEASANTSKTEQPIFGAPDLQLTQTAGTASLKYLGVGWLTSGLSAGYLTGDYKGSSSALNPSYNQTTGGFFASYKLSRTTFDGQIGYSRRASSDGTNDTSGLTGLLDFTDKLTPKTSYTIKIDRMINSYFLNTGSEIDTDAGASLVWQATYKLGVSVGYTFTYRDFPGQGNNPIGSNRIDHQQSATVEINYQLQRWLLIRPYANVQTRHSDFIGGDFNDRIFGVAFTVSYDTKRK